MKILSESRGRRSKAPVRTYIGTLCTLFSWSERVGVGNADAYILLYIGTYNLDTRSIYCRQGSRGVIVIVHTYVGMYCVGRETGYFSDKIGTLYQLANTRYLILEQ